MATHLPFQFYDILTEADTIIDNLTEADGIQVTETSEHDSTTSAYEVGIYDRGIENIKLVNDYITFSDGNSDSADDVDVELGGRIVITGDNDITVDFTTAGAMNIEHNIIHPSGLEIGASDSSDLNTFVDYVVVSETGHIERMEKAAIDWDVAPNYAFKTIVTDEDTLVADSNEDTLTVTGDDIFVAGSLTSDSIEIRNISTLDSVTDRGAVTENDITVGGVNILAGDSGTPGIVFEGPNTDDYETIIGVHNPTADREIYFPDASGTVALLGELNNVLGDLEDVEIASPMDGETILWNSSAGVWENGTVLRLDELGATVDSSFVAGQPANLEYDNTTGVFTYTLGDYVMASGDTMYGDLILDHSNLVFESSGDTVTISQPASYPSGDVELTLPDQDGTIATEEAVNDIIDSITVVTATADTANNGSFENTGGNTFTFTPVDMDYYIRYDDDSRAFTVAGSDITFSNDIGIETNRWWYKQVLSLLQQALVLEHTSTQTMTLKLSLVTHIQIIILLFNTLIKTETLLEQRM